MVMRTCQSILRDEHAVQDAFQATFLILAAGLALFGVGLLLGPWLHQVAYRVACSYRWAAARQRRHERQSAEMTDIEVASRNATITIPVSRKKSNDCQSDTVRRSCSAI